MNRFDNIDIAQVVKDLKWAREIRARSDLPTDVLQMADQLIANSSTLLAMVMDQMDNAVGLPVGRA